MWYLSELLVMTSIVYLLLRLRKESVWYWYLYELILVMLAMHLLSRLFNKNMWYWYELVILGNVAYLVLNYDIVYSYLRNKKNDSA